MKERAACVFEPSSCHVVGGYPFIPLFAENDLCFKLDILVSEEGALHNRQIWPEALRAAKLSVLSPQITLMWNNFIFCLWCFPLISLCCTHPFPSFIFSWTDLQLYCIYLLYLIICSVVLLLHCCQSTLSYSRNAFCFTLDAVWFEFSCVHLPYLGCFTLCVSSLCSLAVFWIPKCSACSLEGE